MKFFLLSENETTLSFLYRFDAIIADAIVEFKLALDKTGALGIDRNIETVKGRDTDAECAIGNVKTCPKGGTSLQKSSKRIKASLEIAATNFSDSCYTIFGEEPVRQKAELKTELSVDFTGTEESLSINVNRERTIAFRILSNGHYYIGLTIHTFSEYICDWMGLFNDCYILHSEHLESSFMHFRGQDELKHMSESNKGYVQSFPASRQKRLQGLSEKSTNKENEKLDDRGY